MNTRNIILLIIFFGGSVNLLSQIDSIDFKLKDSEKSRSFNFGSGIHIRTERNEKIVGLYFTCSYSKDIYKSFHLGFGADVYDDTDKLRHATELGFFLNPFFKLNFFRDKFSLIAGIQGHILLIIAVGDNGGVGIIPMVNIKAQYNANKIFSIGIEYKTTVIIPFLLNGYLSYNF